MAKASNRPALEDHRSVLHFCEECARVWFPADGGAPGNPGYGIPTCDAVGDFVAQGFGVIPAGIVGNASPHVVCPHIFEGGAAFGFAVPNPN